jgi:TolA-binding protein
MPVKVTNPDGTEIDAFTPDEVEAERQRAREEAAREAETRVRAEVEADPNGVAARARKDAERKQKEAEKQVTSLREQLETAGKTAEELTALQAQLAEAKKAQTDATTSVDAIRTEHARDIAMIGAGVQPGRLANVKTVLTAQGVDVFDEKAVSAALETLRTEAPGWFTGTPQPRPPYNPNGGPNNPPRSPGTSRAELAGIKDFREYARVRAEQKAGK